MAERTGTNLRGRTFLGGKIIFNFGESSIDCIVRRITDVGAEIELESGRGVPERFQLLIAHEAAARPCHVSWRSEKLVGVAFEQGQPEETASETSREFPRVDALRNEMLALRAALDHVPLGIVLLDRRLNARFINRAFRKMWALPDEVADHHPSFATLMFHGRDTGAFEMPADRLDAYVAERIELIQRNESLQLDVRRTTGDVMRMNCTPLPDGGRMLTYTEVTDIVRQADELKVVRDALETVQDGVLLLDAELDAVFMNRKVREFWEISPEEAATRPPYASLVRRSKRALAPNLPKKDLASFAASRVAEVKAGDNQRELQTPDGRRLRAHCTKMAGGGRMITYFDVTDLIRNAEQLERLATTDTLTGLYNRRHFLAALSAEWSRFQRYYRSLSVLMVDIDLFKSVNDRYGHAVGDVAIREMAEACLRGKRKSDVVGRVGGEEFAVLLPETSLSRARVVAERIRKGIAAETLRAGDVSFRITASIGIAEASVSMRGADGLLAAADHALFQAKAQGRNRSVSWSSGTDAKVAAE